MVKIAFSPRFLDPVPSGPEVLFAQDGNAAPPISLGDRPRDPLYACSSKRPVPHATRSPWRTALQATRAGTVQNDHPSS